MAKIGGGKPDTSPADRMLGKLLSLQDRRALRKKQEDDVEEALLAWVNMQSGANSHRLYTAAIAYFGIKPVIPD